MWAGPTLSTPAQSSSCWALGLPNTSTPLSQVRSGQFWEKNKIKQMKTKFSSLLPIKLALKNGGFYQEAKRLPNPPPELDWAPSWGRLPQVGGGPRGGSEQRQPGVLCGPPVLRGKGRTTAARSSQIANSWTQVEGGPGWMARGSSWWVWILPPPPTPTHPTPTRLL